MPPLLADALRERKAVCVVGLSHQAQVARRLHRASELWRRTRARIASELGLEGYHNAWGRQLGCNNRHLARNARGAIDVCADKNHSDTRECSIPKMPRGPNVANLRAASTPNRVQPNLHKLHPPHKDADGTTTCNLHLK